MAAGEPLPARPAEPQRPPRRGVAPRIDVARASRRLRSTAHILLGYAGADGAPVVVPVELGAEDERGLAIRCATPLPPGGRRAGLLGHSYKPRLIGLETRQHTGWLEVGEDGSARYAPHTEVGYRAPANKTLLLLLNGALAKRASGRRPRPRRRRSGERAATIASCPRRAGRRWSSSSSSFPPSIVLWGTPGETADRWAWTIKPDLTPIFLGSGYGAGAYFFWRTFRATRWHPVIRGRARRIRLRRADARRDAHPLGSVQPR